MAATQVTFLTTPAPLSDVEFDIETGIDAYLSGGSYSDIELYKKISSPIKVTGSPVKGNKSTPNKRQYTGRRYPSYRDTLNGRFKKLQGKPGSRKNNRWRNDIELGRREDELSDTGPLEDELEEYLFAGMKENIFYRMFEEEEIMRAFRPFIDITEEEEAMLMEFFTESEWDINEDDFEILNFVTPSSVAYQRICTSGKRIISKYSRTEFLEQLDSRIFQFVQLDAERASQDESFSLTNNLLEEIVSSEADDVSYLVTYNDSQLRLTMKDSFHRLIVHSICAYYNAASNSVLNGDGGKVVVIDRPSDAKFTPSQRLVDYLNTTKTDELYWQKPNFSDKKTRKKNRRKERNAEKHALSNSRKSKRRTRKASTAPVEFGVSFVAPPLMSQLS